MTTPPVSIAQPAPPGRRRVLALALIAGTALALAGAGLAAGSQPLYLAALAGAVAGLLALIALQDALLRVMDATIKLTVVWVPFSTGLSQNLGPLREAVRNLDGALALFSFGLLALHFILERRIVIAWTPANWPLAILLTVDLVSMAVNGVPLIIGFAGIRATLQYVLLYYLIVYRNPRAADQRRYLALTCASCTVIAVLTLLELLRDNFLLHVNVPPFATLTDRLALGVYLEFHILLLLALSLRRIDVLAAWPGVRARLPWLTNRVQIGLYAAALLATNSRTAWVGILVGLIALSLLTGYGRKWVLLALGGLVLFAAFIRLSGISQYYDEHYFQIDKKAFFERFLLLFTDRYYALDLYAGRLYYTVLSWHVIVDHPILGVGPGRWGGWVATSVWPSPLYPQYHVIVHYGQFDSAFFPFWAEHGTIGLACLFALWGRIAAWSRRLAHAAADPLFGSLGLAMFMVVISTLAISFISPLLEQHAWSAYLWLLGGLTTVAYRQWLAETRLSGPVPAPAGAAGPAPALVPGGQR